MSNTPHDSDTKNRRWYHPSTLLDKIFEGGIILKGISGIAEFIGGLMLFFVPPSAIHSFLVFITQKEIVEDPHDVIANSVLHLGDHISTGSTAFIIIYLWVHALIKLIAVIGILRNQLWAYPFSLITLGILMLYQVYSIYVHVSIGMILLTVFDVFILWLIWREYGKAKILLSPPQDSA
jgi:uncharacterized membrane protein